MSYRLDPQWESHEIEPDYSGTRWRGHLYKALISVGVLTAFGAAVLYAYSEGAPAGDKPAKQVALPLVRAETAPVKEKPKDPGGVKVPHREADLYRKLDIGTNKADRADPKAERRQARVPPRPQTYEDILSPKRPEPGPETKPASKASKTAERKTARAEPETRRIEVTPQPRTDRPRTDRSRAPEADKPGRQVAALPRLRNGADTGPRDRKVGEVSPRSGDRPEPKARREDRSGEREGVQPASAVGPYRVQLGAFRTPTKAQYEWKTLSRRNKELLSPLRMVIERVDLGPKGVYYRLQAGPFRTEPEARGLCRELGKRKVDCLLVNG